MVLETKIWFFGLFLSCCWIVRLLLYSVYISLIINVIYIYFLLLLVLFLHFLYSLLWNTKFLIFDEVYLFFFCHLCFGDISNKQLLNPKWWRFLSMFSSKSFIVLAFTFRSLVYFTLIFFLTSLLEYNCFTMVC